METSFLGEISKQIIFRSAADNQYSSIANINIDRKRGTTVKVDIPKKRFAELFGTSFNWDILDSTDIFKGEGDDLYLAKIDNFVRKTFDHVKTPVLYTKQLIKSVSLIEMLIMKPCVLKQMEIIGITIAIKMIILFLLFLKKIWINISLVV